MQTAHYTILLVDDEPDILSFLGYNLSKEGYKVLTAENGFRAIELADEHHPQLILLDVMMPGLDGIETCKKIRENPGLDETVIAFLTARNEDYSQLAGFEAGGDDYIAKPIKPGLLVGRVKALLRRNKSGKPKDELIPIGNVRIDRERYIILKDDQPIDLPRKEFELFCLLASKPHKVFSRDEIFSGVWGNNVIVGDRTIDVHIRKLREKIGQDYIRTVKGVGYKFIPH